MSAARLLIVEDDDRFSQILAGAMAKRGFDCVCATDASTAIDSACRQRFDYAIVDLRLGEDSGLIVVQSLAELDPDLAIVVLTGYASVATAVEAIKLGARHYLTKPADADEIVAALDKAAGDPHIDTAEQPLSTRRLEWEHIQKVLTEHNGNISATARALGMHRRTLQRKLQKYPVKK